MRLKWTWYRVSSCGQSERTLRTRWNHTARFRKINGRNEPLSDYPMRRTTAKNVLYYELQSYTMESSLPNTTWVKAQRGCQRVLADYIIITLYPWWLPTYDPSRRHIYNRKLTNQNKSSSVKSIKLHQFIYVCLHSSPHWRNQSAVSAQTMMSAICSLTWQIVPKYKH